MLATPEAVLPSYYIKTIGLGMKDITIAAAAKQCKLSRQTLSKLIHDKARITPRLAIKLAIGFGGTPIKWLTYQMEYDIFLELKKQGEIYENPGDK